MKVGGIMGGGGGGASSAAAAGPPPGQPIPVITAGNTSTGSGTLLTQASANTGSLMLGGKSQTYRTNLGATVAPGVLGSNLLYPSSAEGAGNTERDAGDDGTPEAGGNNPAGGTLI